MSPDLEALQALDEAARQVAAAKGVRVVSVQLVNARGVAVLVLPLTPQQHAEDNGRKEKGRGLSPVVVDILTILRDGKGRLTTLRILEEMAKRGIEWSKTAVESHLSEMMADGIVDNPPDAKPRGYGIVE